MKVQNCLLFSFAGLQLIFLILLSETTQTALAQSPFELPVQIIGFPVIIFSVRLANFVKKLAYSLNPNTYRRKTRSIAGDGDPEPLLDVAEAEKRLIAEMGQNVCIYERICAHYANKAMQHKSMGRVDWGTVLRQYKHSPDQNKEFYLLSVFLGNIVGSPNLCHQLAKRGRACPPLTSWEQ